MPWVQSYHNISSFRQKSLDLEKQICNTKYVESLKKHCTLRVDDIDVYNRIVCYESAYNKAAEKFLNRAKWVPLSHRFDVYI